MEGQSALAKTFSWFVFSTCLWWIVLIPLEYNLFDFILNPLRNLAINSVSVLFEGRSFESDGSGMYLLFCLSICLSVISALVFNNLKLFNNHPPKTLNHNLITFFLSLILIKYGWIKVIKLQFYLPEPNIVYQRFGMLSKDIAYWSLIGTSRIYSVATGMFEVFTGILLLFKRTRFVGFLVAAGIFAHVLLINISFDISVKLFSTTLLVFSIIGVSNYRHKLIFLFSGKLLEDGRDVGSESFPSMLRRYEPCLLRRVIKSAVISVIIVESLYPTISSGIFNDDNVQRPKFHGAYQVLNSEKIDKLYIHRQHYLILEDKAGFQKDFKLELISPNAFAVKDQRTGKSGTLTFWNDYVVFDFLNSDTLKIRKMPYRSLPLMQENSHFFSDSFH